ncbi:MAG: hypothetical protein GWP17_02915 [Aquificales bacterium]|nr:hypothetical protein [Aquificales bacterium]
MPSTPAAPPRKKTQTSVSPRGPMWGSASLMRGSHSGSANKRGPANIAAAACIPVAKKERRLTCAYSEQ